ncbi:hypothetical protein QN277_029097 [Acacia crassicarpa]|uniref:RING-type domain-containing protein n=1 Tax=Acacia crassicarpa TaxID=499986 RepID=A0AAE1K288_9FABA|nr:hypothetical protein QN277_029097 [Acacia crassicarpa]
MLFNFVKLASQNLKWFIEFITYHPFHSMRVHHQLFLQDFEMVTEEEERVEIWRPREGGEEEVDCAVCLSKIGEGDEVRVLRCEHVFHRGCLNQLIGLRNYTCPLCRYFLGGTRHVIFYGFSETHQDRENWWLR